MKQIFTLLALGILSQASAQSIIEDFESYSTTSQLTDNCWSFSGVILHPSTGINSTKSLQVIPVNSNGGGNDNNALIITPYINFQPGKELTFQYKLNNDLSSNATRILNFSTMSASGAITPIPEAQLFLNATNTSAAQVYTAHVTVNTATTERLVIDFDGNRDGNSYIFIDNFTYTSMFACASQSILPIKLMSFAGSLVNRKAQLRWAVADNETGNHFVMERSTDGKSFTDAGLIIISERIGSESYTFTESKDLTTNTYYRLRIVNKDGSVTYSNIIVLKSGEEGPGGDVLTLLQNPMQSQLAFSYQTLTAGAATVTLYSMAGVKLMSFETYLQPGANTVQQTLPASVGSGTYVLEVEHSGQRRSTKPIK